MKQNMSQKKRESKSTEGSKKIEGLMLQFQIEFLRVDWCKPVNNIFCLKLWLSGKGKLLLQFFKCALLMTTHSCTCFKFLFSLGEHCLHLIQLRQKLLGDGCPYFFHLLRKSNHRSLINLQMWIDPIQKDQGKAILAPIVAGPRCEIPNTRIKDHELGSHWFSPNLKIVKAAKLKIIK